MAGMAVWAASKLEPRDARKCLYRGYMGIMEKKNGNYRDYMWVFRGSIGYILGIYGDNGKEKLETIGIICGFLEGV